MAPSTFIMSKLNSRNMINERKNIIQGANEILVKMNS